MPMRSLFQALVVLFVLAVTPAAMAHGDDGPAGTGRLLISRLHVLLVHFPIALLITAAGLEAVNVLRTLVRRTPEGEAPTRAGASSSATVCLCIGSVAAFAAAWSGWTNADVEHHGEGLRTAIELHRWAGASAAVLSILTAGMLALASAMRSGRFLRMYRGLLLLSAISVGVAGHLGGSLVHGSGYLTEVIFGTPSTTEPSSDDREPAPVAPVPEPAPEPDPEPEAPSEPERPIQSEPLVVTPVDFNTQIKPILEDQCLRCHRAGNAKGGLRLDTRTDAFVAYDDYANIVPGDPEASELYVRISLEVGNRLLMPKRAPKLPDADIELVRRWIEEGAEWPDTGAD